MTGDYNKPKRLKAFNPVYALSEEEMLEKVSKDVITKALSRYCHQHREMGIKINAASKDYRDMMYMGLGPIDNIEGEGHSVTSPLPYTDMLENLVYTALWQMDIPATSSSDKKDTSQ